MFFCYTVLRTVLGGRGEGGVCFSFFFFFFKDGDRNSRLLVSAHSWAFSLFLLCMLSILSTESLN